MEKINQIWNQQEHTPTEYEYLMQKYSGEMYAEIFVAFHVPVKKFCLIVQGRHLHNVNVKQFTGLQEIKVFLIRTSDEDNAALIVIELQNSSNREIFSVLCADLIHSVKDGSDEKWVTDHIFRRLKTWKAIFESGRTGALTEEQQIGLYGELYLLRLLLEHQENAINVVHSWTGPDKEARDFQFSNWGIEVKTSAGSDTHLVKISNKKQLDTQLVERLYLYRITLERLNQTGESLPELIEKIERLLEQDAAAYDRFCFCLYQAGYFKTDEEEYRGCGYRIRSREMYEVHDRFPRLEEAGLPAGVEEISYVINLACCRAYHVNEEFVLKNLMI